MSRHTERRDREMLDVLVGVTDNADQTDLEGAIRYFLDKAPASLTDRESEAARDANQRVAEATAELHTSTGAPSPRAVAILAAIVARCVGGHCCEHAPALDRVTYCFAGTRVATCDQCIARYRGAIVANDRRAAEGLASRCDVCLRPTSGFVSAVRSIGPAVIQLQACPSCEALLVE